MKTIIICGDCGSFRLTNEIVRLCSDHGGTLFVGQNRISCSCGEPSYLIISAAELSELDLPGSIIVLGRELRNIGRSCDLSAYTIVLDAENTGSLRFASDCGAQALGCSMSGHDSLTVSSFGADGRIVLALRRSINTDKGVVTPGEFIIEACAKDNIYPLLAAYGVLLLSGVDLF